MFMDDFQNYINELKRDSKPICGDYNICHEAIDIHDPVRKQKNVSDFCLKRGLARSVYEIRIVDSQVTF
jgi:exodeoxyribonuclease-3